MREIRLSGSVEGVRSNPDPYSDSSEPWSDKRCQVYSVGGSRRRYQSITELIERTGFPVKLGLEHRRVITAR